MRAILSSAIVVVALVQSHFCDGATYTVTDLGTLGGTESEAYGINNNGQVVGNAKNASGASRAYMYNAGTMTDLGTLGGEQSFAFAINNEGEITGTSELVAGNSTNRHAFLFTGSMIDLGTLANNTKSSTGTAINDSGQVAGFSSTSGIQQEAFLYSGGPLQPLGNLISQSGGGSAAEGINAAGQVVGTANQASHGSIVQNAFLYGGTMQDLGVVGTANAINHVGQVAGQMASAFPGHLHAFLYSGSTIQDLGTLISPEPPSGAESRALAINTSGQIVGRSQAQLPSAVTDHAFIFSNGHMSDLNSLILPSSGWQLTDATGINDFGQIVGNGMIGGQQHGFLLTPVPEPSSVMLACLGFVCLIAWGWRRQKR